MIAETLLSLEDDVDNGTISPELTTSLNVWSTRNQERQRISSLNSNKFLGRSGRKAWHWLEDLKAIKLNIMDATSQRRARTIQVEEELRKKNGELARYSARFEALESKMVVRAQDGQRMVTEVVDNTGQKILVNKPEVLKGGSVESLDSFLEHMNLYLDRVQDDMKLRVAVSYLSGHELIGARL